jgi:hypothetical protein
MGDEKLKEMERYTKQLEFITEIDSLKHVLRIQLGTYEQERKQNHGCGKNLFQKEGLPRENIRFI